MSLSGLIEAMAETHAAEIARLTALNEAQDHGLKMAAEACDRLTARAEQLTADNERLHTERLRIDRALAEQFSRAERAERALRNMAEECSTFPIRGGLAFRCESLARGAFGDEQQQGPSALPE